MDADYDDAWKEYKTDQDVYWTKIAEKLHWHKKWDKLYEFTNRQSLKWFVGGKLSVSYNCLDKPIQEGLGDKDILLCESDLTRHSYKLSYQQIFDQVVKLAGFLRNHGLKENDHVIVNLPLIPETIISFLAINRVGGVYLSVAEGYTQNAIRDKIEEFHPKIIITANVGLVDGTPTPLKSNLDSALATSKVQPNCCIVLQREIDGYESAQLTKPRDISWNEALSKAQPFLDCIPVDACQPFFLIYTSGSSGKAKPIVHAVGSFAVGLVKDNLKSWGCYNGEPFFCGGRFAWISAHCTIATGPLLVKTPSVVYEAAVPFNLHRLYSIWAKHGINYAFLAVPQQKTIIKEDPEGLIAKSCGPYKLKGIVAAGTAYDEYTMQYFKNTFGVPAVAIYGQTELGSSVTTTKQYSNGDKIMDQPVLSAGLVMPGMNVKILKDDMTEAAVREVGRITLKLPVPPGVLMDMYNYSEYFWETIYGTFPGYYDTKDEGYIDENGYLYITNRFDDVYKIKGDRIACDGIESVAAQHPQIEEIVAVLDVIKTEQGGFVDYIPVVFYITKQGCKTPNEEIEKEIKELVQQNLCQNIIFSRMYRASRFPVLTSSSKLARGTIRNLVRNHKEMKGPPETTDRDVLHIWEILKNGH
ncbi:Acyl-CoA synthetase short-chain member 3, mitochondrial [Chamberlinius hualienensis]